MKLINNYMSMVGMVMTAETIHFAKSLGIDQSKAVKILQGTAAGKGQININFPQKVLIFPFLHSFVIQTVFPH